MIHPFTPGTSFSSSHLNSHEKYKVYALNLWSTLYTLEPLCLDMHPSFFLQHFFPKCFEDIKSLPPLNPSSEASLNKMNKYQYEPNTPRTQHTFIRLVVLFSGVVLLSLLFFRLWTWKRCWCNYYVVPAPGETSESLDIFRKYSKLNKLIDCVASANKCFHLLQPLFL